MRITALKPGVTTEYGISVPIATTAVVGDEYGKSLVLSLRAADTDGVLPRIANTPFDDGVTPRVVYSSGVPAGLIDPTTGAPLTSGDPIVRTVTRFAGKYLGSASSTLAIIGDSWGAGNGASNPSQTSYAARLRDTVIGKALFANYGFSGRPITGFVNAPKLEGTGPTNLRFWNAKPADVVIGMIGLNDLIGVGTVGQASGPGSDPKHFATVTTRLHAMVTKLLVPESCRVRMNNGAGTPNPAVTCTGAWTQGYGTNNNVAFTTTANGSARALLPKGNLLIVRTTTVTGTTNQWAVSVNGVNVHTWVPDASFDDQFANDCVVIPLNTNVPNDVTVSLVGTGLLMVDSIDSIDTTVDFGATLLYGTPTHLLAGAWNSGGNILNSAVGKGVAGTPAEFLFDNGGSDRFDKMLCEAFDKLYDLGFNVVNCHPRVGFNPLQHTSAGDLLHPNDAGHRHIYQSFLLYVRQLYDY